MVVAGSKTNHASQFDDEPKAATAMQRQLNDRCVERARNKGVLSIPRKI